MKTAILIGRLKIMVQACSAILLISAGFLFCSFGIDSVNRVNVAKFGAVPNDNRNDAPPLRKAIVYAKAHPGITLYFPPGVYNFRDEKAVGLMDSVMKGDIKGNPQEYMFRPYFPYVKGLDFNGVKDITIEANGAVLLADGWMEPVSLNNCRNITIKGLTIDYKRRPHSIGLITNVQSGYYDVSIDSIYPMSAVTPLCRISFYDTKAHRILNLEQSFPKFEVIAPQQLRIYNRIAKEMAGNQVMIVHSFHFRPAILMLEAKNIMLQDVTIHSQPGMGIVGHRSENISLNGLRIIPGTGSVMSTNTDATHFTSCKGYIKYTNCQFEGHGDDAVNIHNYYLNLQKTKQIAGYDLILKNADWHAQVLDYPDAGDKMELVNKNTLAVVKTVTVKTVHNNIPALNTHITLTEPLPVDIENYYLINVTRLPRVTIAGCTVTSNRARGFLIKTRDVLIERCLIRETTGTGIHVGAEGNWHEGPGSARVVIRYNRIIRCGSGAGSVGASGIAVKVDATVDTAPDIHKHILIEGNIIEGENAENGIVISGTRDVTIQNNEISGCKNLISIHHSKEIKMHNNGGNSDGVFKFVK